MEIDGQFYLCGEWQPFMGNDVTCDCGYDGNEFTDDELADLEEAVEDAEEDY